MDERASPAPQGASGSPLFEGQGLELRRNWYVPSLGLAMTALGLWTVFGTRGPNSAFGLFALWMGPFLALLPLLRNAFPLSRRLTLRADAGRLCLGEGEGVREVDAQDIVEAKLVPREGKEVDTVADFTLRDGARLRLWLARPEATRLLHALGVGVGQRRATFERVVPFGARYLIVSLGLGLPVYVLQVVWAWFNHKDALLAVVAWPFIVAFFSFLPAWMLGLVRGRVVVGADGLLLRWLFRERFVGFNEVAAVRSVESRLAPHVIDTVVERTAGRPIRLRALEMPDTENERGTSGKALFAHVTRAWATWQERGPSGAAPALLARSGRSSTEWRQALDGLARGTARGYRAVAVSAERLVEIARDPLSPGDVRAGAAAALVLAQHSEHKETVRVAAEACADPGTRAALLALAEAENEAAVEQALSRVT